MIGSFPPSHPSRSAMFEIGSTICLAYVLDLLMGDPRYGYHPIKLIGALVARFERLLRDWGCAGRGGGMVLVFGSVICTLGSYYCIEMFFSFLHPFLSFLFNLFIVYSCLAIGDLLRHIKPVLRALENQDLEGARRSLSLTVGRDVRALDRAGIARAAIETLAENFVDGFLSPVFWYFIGSLVFLLLGLDWITGGTGTMLFFKVASTLDSMVGYKNDRYLAFGWGGARLDDLMNFIPARLSILFLFVGALFTGLRSLQGLKTALRDRLEHESPNSAHPESFAAGALGIRLGGPTLYPEGMKMKPWLGDGTVDAQAAHLHKAMTLIRAGAWIAVLPLFMISIIAPL